MPQVRLPFIPSGFLNTANSVVDTGQYEPITGLPLPSGITPGAWFDMTEDEAQRYSNTAIGTLHSGRYQWVQLSATAVNALPNANTGGLQRGQGLFWVPASTLPQSYIVTNVPVNATSSPVAGVFLNTPIIATAQGIAPVTPGNWFFMQTFAGPGRATVKLRATITATAPAIGDTIAGALVASGGADSALFDDISGVDETTSIGAEIGAAVGTSEAAPSNGALIIIDIVRQIGG